jgi:transposase
VTSLESHLQWLNAEIDALDQQLRQLLLSNHAWRRAVEHLNTVPSLGPVSIAALMAATHGFVRCQTPEQAAAFAGLAPHTHTSGTSVRGQASIGGGHASLRRILYMCALSAIRYNPVLRDFYQHLLRNGKHKKVALCAVARKLVHIAWAVVVRDRDFDPHFHPAT